MTKAAIGILAHVDAGKTTLCEALLYLTGRIRQRGRVDHGDAHLDTHALERRRGITIFSKQADISTDGFPAVLIDTPGHVDFSTEAERALRVIDCAVLLVSGIDGVEAHTRTLFSLLRRYAVPTVIFVNKMDIAGRTEAELMKELERELSPRCADFSRPHKERDESAALADEELFKLYSENGGFSGEELRLAVAERRLFPCFFGSALRLDGVREFLSALPELVRIPDFPEEFGARVYKISRDPSGTRLTHLRVTGGRLEARMPIVHESAGEDGAAAEKIAEIRLYTGDRYVSLREARAGDVVAVTGLDLSRPGEGLGYEAKKKAGEAILTPVLNYRIALPAGADPLSTFRKLRELSEEDPLLSIEWDERTREIRARLMGEVQIEILKSLIKERFGLEVGMDEGRVLYKETILAPVEGVGHYEPLRHYAEVHLFLEPLPPGSGIEVGSAVSVNDLDLNWQRLIITHLLEKTHLGVLTGSPITDIRLTLIAGRSHLKHTEGGDFRQATYRAVRQGLMKAKSVLLEPYYAFRIELPREQLGRAISDIRMMGGSFSMGDAADPAFAAAEGYCPVAAMRGYASSLAAYTGGRGRISLEVSHYGRCANESEVVTAIGYEPERDLDNTPDSVFCAHGGGFTVKWNEVENYMHIDTGIRPGEGARPSDAAPRLVRRNLDVDEKELESIMLREFGPIKRPDYGKPREEKPAPERPIEKPPEKKDYLIVDGYNVLFAWEGLRRLAADDIATARHRLTDILADYRAFKKNEVFLIFDGYRVKGNAGERSDYHGLHVAYTKENETADMLIERMISEIGKNYSVRVASSDGMIQLSSVRSGALRMTAKELEDEVETANEKLHELMEKLKKDAASVKIELPPEAGSGGEEKE